MSAERLQPLAASARKRRRAAVLAGAIVTATAFVAPIIGPEIAHAAPPQFSNPPTRVYTAPGVDLPFTGSDPITGDTKDIVVNVAGDDSTCVVENPGDEGDSGNCVYAQIQILEANRGAMTIDDSAISYNGSNRSGDIVFNIGGKAADIQNALASLTYVPPDSSFETTDGTPVTLRVNVQAPQPTPDSAYIDVDIRVEGDNAFPDITAPAGSPFEVEVDQDFELLESAGTEVFHVTDEDAEQGEIDDYLMGIAWVDCGLISFPVGDGYTTYEGDPEDLLATLGEDVSLLPAEVSQNLVFGTGFDHVEAIAWAAHIDQDNDDFEDNFNNVMRWITFHAPSTAGTCTLTIVVTDLGNNGMPLPEEIPFPGVDFDSVEFNVVDPSAPTTTEAPPDDTTTTTSSTSVPDDDTTTTSTQPGDDTTTTSTQPGDDTTTTSSTTPGDDTTTTSTTEPCATTAGVPCRTTTTSSTVPGDDTTTTTQPGDDTTTTSSTVPGDDTTTTSTTAPGDDTTTTTSTSTTSTTSTTTTTVPCPDGATTTTVLIADTTTTVPPTLVLNTQTSTSSSTSTSTSTTTSTTVPCVPPTTTTVPVCVTTTTAAPTTVTTAPPEVTTAPPTVAETTTTAAETTTSIADTTTTTTTTTTLPIPADTTTTTLRPPRTTTTTIIVGIPTFTIQTTTTLGPVPLRSAPRPEHAVGQAEPCPGATTTVPGGPTTSVGGSTGSIPPLGSLPPTGIQTLPVTGADTSTAIVIAALLFLAGSTSVVLTRRRR